MPKTETEIKLRRGRIIYFTLLGCLVFFIVVAGIVSLMVDDEQVLYDAYEDYSDMGFVNRHGYDEFVMIRKDFDAESYIPDKVTVNNDVVYKVDDYFLEVWKGSCNISSYGTYTGVFYDKYDCYERTNDRLEYSDEFDPWIITNRYTDSDRGCVVLECIYVPGYTPTGDPFYVMPLDMLDLSTMKEINSNSFECEIKIN